MFLFFLSPGITELRRRLWGFGIRKSNWWLMKSYCEDKKFGCLLLFFPRFRRFPQCYVLLSHNNELKSKKVLEIFEFRVVISTLIETARRRKKSAIDFLLITVQTFRQPSTHPGQCVTKCTLTWRELVDKEKNESQLLYEQWCFSICPQQLQEEREF